MGMGFLPKTRLGKASVILTAVDILVTGALLALVSRGSLEPATMPVWIAGLTSLLTLAAFVTGIIGILKFKERAILVYLSLIALLLLYVLAEFLFPH